MAEQNTDGLREQIRDSRERFQREQLRHEPETVGYKAGRHLLRVAEGWEGVESSVMDFLPTHDGKNLVEILDERAIRATADEPMRLLDIGSGQSVTLSEIEDRYGDKVQTFGLTAARFPGEVPIRGDVQSGDLAYLHTLYPADFFDVVYSSRTLSYANRHLTDLYPRIYQVVKPGGIALLDSLAGNNPDLSSIGKFDAVKNWLDQHGYDFEFNTTDNWEQYFRDMMVGFVPSFDKERADNNLIITSASFKKTNDRLVLPVSHVDKGVFFDPTKADSLKVG